MRNGSTSELFFLGLPSVNVVTEENQRQAFTAIKQHTYSGIMFAYSIGNELIHFVIQLVSDK